MVDLPFLLNHSHDFINWDKLLLAACKYANPIMVHYAIKRGATCWPSAFIHACEGGDIKLVTYFEKKLNSFALAHGIVLCGLEKACVKGHFKVVLFLFYQYHYNNRILSCFSAVKKAIQGNQQHIVKFFLDQSFPLQKVIEQVVECGQFDLFQTLTQQVIDNNGILTQEWLTFYTQMLKIAIERKHNPIVEFILNLKLNLFPDSFILACRHHNDKAALLLLNNELRDTGYLDPSFLNQGYYWLLSHSFFLDHHTPLYEFLIKHGANIALLPLTHIIGCFNYQIINAHDFFQKDKRVGVGKVWQRRMCRLRIIYRCFNSILCEDLLDLLFEFIHYEAYVQ
jgi:hypothetical protein